WDLTNLFADVSKWNEDVEWITRTYPRITEWKGRVGASPRTLAEVLEFEQQLDLKIERVYHFASLQLAEDSANNDYLARIGFLQNLMTKLAAASAFVVPEIQAIDDGSWEKFVADPALKDWKIPLHKIRRMRPHVLSEREERLLALGAAALDGYDDAFSQLTNVDMKFGVLIDVDGREKPLTQSTYSSFLLKRDRDLRQRALGLDQLRAYDTYVPLVPEIETHVSFDQAINKVIASLAPLGQEYTRTLADGLRGRWCDRFETKGERSGAFSSGSYQAPPYILM